MEVIITLIAVLALFFALSAHVRISKESAQTDNDFASYNRRVTALCNLYDELEELTNRLEKALDELKTRPIDEDQQAQNIREWLKGMSERLDSIESRFEPTSKEEKRGSALVPADQAEESNMTEEFRSHLEKSLVLYAIHCQQSVRDWMHECQWNLLVDSRSVKEELARIMQLMAKYPRGYWRDIYSQYEYPQWIRDIFKTDPPNYPDSGVRTILARLHNQKKRDGIDVQELKPFPYQAK